MKFFVRKIKIKFCFFFIVSLLISFIDVNSNIFFSLKKYLLNTINKFYLFKYNVKSIIENINNTFDENKNLMLENEKLKEELLINKNNLYLLNQIKEENENIKKILNIDISKNEKKIISKVLDLNNDCQLIINKGLKNNVKEGQPVLNEKGIIGQVIFSGFNYSKILLLCNSLHSIPVKVLRNGNDFIINGDSCKSNLVAKNLPYNLDIKVGDKLVTSGIGGRFPKNYPVAVVTFTNIDSNNNILVNADMLVNIKKIDYVLIMKEFN